MCKGMYLGGFERCIKSDNYAEVYDAACDVAMSGDPYLICDFAESVPLADDPEIMETLEYGIQRCNDIYHEYEFAFTMADSGKKYFNQKLFEKRFRESGIAKIMYYCMECLAGCDVREMESALMGTKDTKYIEHLMNNEEVDRKHSHFWYKSAIENFTREQQASGKRYLPKQLETLVRGLNVTKDDSNDEYLLINAGNQGENNYNPMHVNMCAEYTNCDKDKAFHLMMESDDILHIYEYYCSAATEEQKEEIFENVTKSGYAKVMY